MERIKNSSFISTEKTKGCSHISLALQPVICSDVSRKLKDNSFSLQDLLELSEMTNTDICFVDRKTQTAIITISKNDIESEDSDSEEQ